MRLVGIVLCLSGVAWATTAPPVQLTWQAPRECPSEGDVLHEVARLEGLKPVLLTSLKVTVQVEQVGTQWAAVMRTESNGATGQRSFAADECQQLADAAALIIAIAHCPELLALEPTPPPALVEPSSRVSVAAGIFAASDIGSLVGPSFGAGLEVAVRVERFGIKVLGLRTLAQHALRGPEAQSAIDVQGLVGLGARGCWYALDARVQLAPCVGVDGWLLQTTSSQVTSPSSGSGWWVGPVVGGLIGVRLFERLALTVSVEGGAAATRPTFVIDGYGQVDRTSEFVGRLRGGIEVRLW